MRAELIQSLPRSPGLCALSDEIRALLQLWFDPGFLRLEQIDWQSPASVLDQLFRFEAVHPIDGWRDLRRRLASDRRESPGNSRDEALRRLCAFYLLEARAGVTRIIDAEARFHLRNGASLDRINMRADLSERGLRRSYGLMANYTYRLRDIDRNYQAAQRGRVIASRQLVQLLRSLRAVQ